MSNFNAEAIFFENGPFLAAFSLFSSFQGAEAHCTFNIFEHSRSANVVFLKVKPPRTQLSLLASFSQTLLLKCGSSKRKLKSVRLLLPKRPVTNLIKDSTIVIYDCKVILTRKLPILRL